MGNSLLFAAPEPSYHPLEYQDELLWAPRGSEQEPQWGVPCLLLQHPEAVHFLIYFHANSEDLGHIYMTLRYLRTLLRVHVLAVEYPGYGICSGTPTERRVLADAEIVLDLVRDQLEVPVDRIMFMGRSLGGGPAIYLASRCQCAGLVTVGAFSSIYAVVGSFAGMTGWLVDVFDNGERIRSVRCPTLILHGLLDEIVSADQAQELADACGVDAHDRKRVKLSISDNLGHNDFHIKNDIIHMVLNAFPGLDRGERLQLANLGDVFRPQPEVLAPDVLQRVAFPPGWRPAAPPFSRLKIIGADGDEL